MQGNIITPLSELRPISTLYNIHVRVSRTWEYKGKSEKNPLIHFDMVVIDQKGYAMYCEVPPQVLPRLQQYLQEGKVLYIWKACVERAKPGYRVVDAPYMLKLIMRTEISEGNSNDTTFPKYVFSLIPIEVLPQYERRTDRFLDVIGKITAISNAAVVRDTSGELIMRRLITLQDLKGNTVDLSLSGQRALEFNAETVFNIGQNHHIIAIFVGILYKVYQGDYKFLSGTSACRWYINENDIPEMRTFRRGLPSQVTPVQKLQLLSEDYMEQGVEEKTMFDLKQIDPLADRNKRFQCTVTLISLAEKEQWCYRACRVCNSTIKLGNDGYACTKDGCSCKQYDWKYKVCFSAADDTYSLQFMFFEKKGLELIGKSAEALRKQYDPSSIPPEISQWIGHKFTFIVKVLFKRSLRSIEPSFEVVMIKERHEKQATLPNTIHNVSNDDDLPPLMAIPSNKKIDQASSSYSPQFTDIQDMDIDHHQSDAWDTTEKHIESQKNENDEKRHEEQQKKKLKSNE